MSPGYVPGYEDDELEQMETALLLQDLARRIDDAVLPRRG